MNSLQTHLALTHPDEDKLGWDVYVRHIVDALQGANVKHESLVISITGPWGSGKSTLKNFVLHHLRKDPNARWDDRILEFNPWWWSDSTKMTDAFFKQIGKTIRSGVDDTAEADSLVRDFGRFNALLGFTADSLDYLNNQYKQNAASLKSVEIVASGAGMMALGEAIGSPFGATGIAVGATAGAFLGGFLRVIWENLPALLRNGPKWAEALKKPGESWLKFLEASKKQPQEPDEKLERLRKQLRERFSNLKKPLLVVFDDLDRLTKDELKVVFQLVKANGDFPNLIYLLLMEREVVEQSLGELFPKSIEKLAGRAFLEKIVHMQLRVPPVDFSKRKTYIDERIKQIFTDANLSDTVPDSERLEVSNTLANLLDRLRDINRVLDSFRFTLPLFVHSGQVAVYPCDLAILEALRYCEPIIHEKLSDFLPSFVISKRDRNIADLLKRCNRVDPDYIRNALILLFPMLTQPSTNVEYQPTAEDQQLKRVRIQPNLEFYLALQPIFVKVVHLEERINVGDGLVGDGLVVVQS